MKIILLLGGVFVFSLMGYDPPARQLEDIKKFYFPYLELEEPRIYQYLNPENPEETRYLHLRSYVRNSKYFLVSTSFDSGFNKQEEVTKRIGPVGPIITEYIVYPNDQFGKPLRVPCFIEKSEIIHWMCKPGDKVGWKVSYPIPTNPDCQRVFIKKREYLNQSEFRTFDGRSYRTCRFFDTFESKEICSSSGKRLVPSSIFRQNYYYAQGIGLIEFRYTNSAGMKKTFKLNKVLDQAQWMSLCSEE